LYIPNCEKMYIVICHLQLGRIDESYEMYRDLVAQHEGIDLSGVAGDLTDLINKEIMVKEARYILRNILNMK
jgi:hypothetical protein